VKQKIYTFIDLFAGCGGLSEGFLSTKRFNALAHIEWEKPMVDTLRYRLKQQWNHSEEEAEKRVIQFDIQKTDELVNGGWSEESIGKFGSNNHPSIIQSGLNGLIGKDTQVDLIIGGPPCQAYSIHGRATDKDSMQNDYRNYLFESFCRLVDIYKPKVFVFENVAGLLSAKPGGVPVRNRIYEAFTKIGYTIRTPEAMATALFDAGDFNVPQHRPRVIILGVKEGSNINLDDLYESIANSKTKEKPTVKDAILNLPKLYPLDEPIISGRNRRSHTLNTDSRFTQHDARNHSARDREIFREWVTRNMNHISHQEMIDYYFLKTGHSTLFQKYKSLEWDKPSHTVVAHLSKDGYMFIHPDATQERSITIREAACLMTFPLDYSFLGSTPYNYKMIGNAVPVNFAKGVANGIVKVLDRNKI